MKLYPYTPGPWHTDQGRQINSAGLHVAYIEEAPGLGHEAEGNAVLRDAAPTLYEVLDSIMAEAADALPPALAAKASEALIRARRVMPAPRNT